MILDLFEAFPGYPVSDFTAQTYVEAAEGCSPEAIRRAMVEYRTGRVPDQNKRKPPMAPEFADRARLHQAVLDNEFARSQRSLLPAPPKEHIEVDPAMRKRVGKLMLGLAAKMEGRNMEKARETYKARPSNDAEAMGDPRPLGERLGRLAQPT